jgi:hypothetical protein
MGREANRGYDIWLLFLGFGVQACGQRVLLGQQIAEQSSAFTRALDAGHSWPDSATASSSLESAATTASEGATSSDVQVSSASDSAPSAAASAESGVDVDASTSTSAPVEALVSASASASGKPKFPQDAGHDDDDKTGEKEVFERP